MKQKPKSDMIRGHNINKPRVNVELSPELYQSITRLAAREGRSRANFVRRAVQREVARLEAEQEATA